ncbi:MAG: sporulation protein YabP [Clostridia bacterium]|nr:sporulation protein YabP [Clostridia bacterium]
MNLQSERQTHEFCVKMRKDMNISGVKEVESFDETCVMLHTHGGTMTVEGSGLRVGTLDLQSGMVSLSGKIDAVYYSIEQTDKKHGFLGKLLR